MFLLCEWKRNNNKAGNLIVYLGTSYDLLFIVAIVEIVRLYCGVQCGAGWVDKRKQYGTIAIMPATYFQGYFHNTNINPPDGSFSQFRKLKSDSGVPRYNIYRNVAHLS